MAKRLIEGKERSKGKRYSHRPQRAQNCYWHEVDGCWYSKPKVDIEK